MGEQLDAGAVDDFVHGVARIVAVGRREIGVVRWFDDFYALRNVCPHEAGPLCRGRVAARIEGDPGEAGSLAIDESRPTLTCPWHGWEFDVKTGFAVADRRLRVRTFDVATRDGRVYVDLSRKARDNVGHDSIEEVPCTQDP
jgi:nitrite reductase/ring-hydroxylating ferredoxin subunit